jgi:hypothetical protein
LPRASPMHALWPILRALMSYANDPLRNLEPLHYTSSATSARPSSKGCRRQARCASPRRPCMPTGNVFQHG